MDPDRSFAAFPHIFKECPTELKVVWHCTPPPWQLCIVHFLIMTVLCTFNVLPLHFTLLSVGSVWPHLWTGFITASDQNIEVSLQNGQENKESYLGSHSYWWCTYLSRCCSFADTGTGLSSFTSVRQSDKTAAETRRNVTAVLRVLAE